MKKNYLRLIAVLLIFSWISSSCDVSKGKLPDAPDESDPQIETYKEYEVNGFTLKVSESIKWDKELNDAYQFLGKSLDYFYKVLPSSIASKVVDQIIYVNNDPSESVDISYVAQDEALKAEDVIIIHDLSGFYKSSFCDLGASLIEVFAEAYYDQYLTADQKSQIAETFKTSATLYGNDPAAVDACSYFARLSRTYFSLNDRVPKDYHELISFDPDGFSLMENIWMRRALRDYERVVIEGFRVMYPIKYKNDAATLEALSALRKDLKMMTELIPGKFVDLMRRKILWLDNTNENGAACYHDNIDWLLSNGYIRDKSKCVELNNMKHYVEWSRVNQPLMVLHEHAHMYHFSSYAQSNEILAAYENAMNAKLYEMVDYFDGTSTSQRKAYAATNQYEYFSELSEAYFGQNDYFPFNREDLKKHDPVGYAMIEKVWDEKNFRE